MPSDDSPQQSDPLDSNKPDTPPFDQKGGLFQRYGVFGHSQNSPDSDGLSDNWEQGGWVDANTDGQNAGSGLAEVQGNDGMVSLGGQSIEKEPPPSNDSKESVEGGAVAHELGHVSQSDHGGPSKDEGGQNLSVHKLPVKPSPIILVIIAVLLLLTVGFISVMNYTYNSGSANDDVTATSPSESQADTSENPQGGSEVPAPASVPSASPQPVTGGGAEQPAQTVTEPPAECAAGWFPASGCVCCGTTLVCADGVVAEFNPQCGVGGGSGGSGGGCQCSCPAGQPNCYDSCTGAICAPP